MIDSSIDKLKEAIGDACIASYMPIIIKGRETIFSLQKEWVIEHIDAVAKEILNLSDEWHYRRLLEVYEKLDHQLLINLIEDGLKSTNTEVVEAAKDFMK